MSEHRYRNPWSHDGFDYVRTVEPIEYHGGQIFHVLPGQYDIVKAGVCISQRGGLAGARLVAEAVEDMPEPTYHDVQDRMLALHGHV